MIPFRLAPLRALLLGGLLIAVAGSVVTAWGVGALVESWFTAHDAQRVRELVRTQFADHVDDTAGALTAAAGVADMGRDLLTLPDVFRVKVFDRGGRIVWSNEPALVGRVFGDNPSLARALAGETVVGLVRPHKTEHEYERGVARMREVYVPIGPPARPPIGVVEVYLDAASFDADVAHARLVLAGISAGTALALWTLLALAVWRASRALAQARERERRDMEARLALVERLRAFGEIAAGATHDLGNVFMALSGRIQILARHGASAPLPATAIQSMQRAIDDGVEITRRLSHMRRADSEPALERVSVRAVVEDVLDLTEPRWQHCPGIEVEPVLREVPPVVGRASELREVFTNLVLNALDAMPDGGRLTITTTAMNGHVDVEVADTGIGMTPDVRRRLFVPFSTTKPNGTGLGLSVSYGIVKRHGGTIDVETGPGKGSRFVVRLPRAPIGTGEIAIS